MRNCAVEREGPQQTAADAAEHDTPSDDDIEITGETDADASKLHRKARAAKAPSRVSKLKRLAANPFALHATCKHMTRPPGSAHVGPAATKTEADGCGADRKLAGSDLAYAALADSRADGKLAGPELAAAALADSGANSMLSSPELAAAALANSAPALGADLDSPATDLILAGVCSEMCRISTSRCQPGTLVTQSGRLKHTMLE